MNFLLKGYSVLIKYISNYLLIFLLLVFTLFSGCKSENHPVNPENPEKSWYYEDDFAQDATLHAEIHNAVILDISSPKQLGGSESHVARYEYNESGEHVYCIDPDEKYITEMTLLDERGNIELTLKKDEGCANIYLYAGRYTIQITHDVSKVPELGTVAFIHHPSDAAKESAGDTSNTKENVSDDSNPPYYAFKVKGGSYDGYYLGTKQEKLFDGSSDFLGVIPASDKTSFEEKRHLFSWKDEDYLKNVLQGYDWSSYFIPQNCSMRPFFCVPSQDSSLDDGNTVFYAYNTGKVDLYLQEEGDQTYTLWNDAIMFVLNSSSLYAAENSLLYRTSTTKESTSPTLFTKNSNMRLYKDGSSYTLQNGEVAFSEACNLEGPIYVIDGDVPDAVSVSLPQIKSIKFGSDETNIIFFGKKDYQDWQKTVGMDEACLETPLSLTMGSIKILNAKKVFISSHKCDYCDLVGADFSNLDLENVSLRYANLANVQFNNSILQKADMRYVKLYGANLNYADLNGSTLCGAFLNGNSLSSNRAASLTGAYLKNVNLADSNLNGANFTSANFYSDTSVGCIPKDCGYSSCASAANATLDSVNFNNAYMTGVDFSNSSVLGSNFTNAVLTGTVFKNATLDRDPDTGASTNFSGAFIQGADFTDARVSGTNFASAYIDLANSGGSLMFFKLSGAHSEFAGWIPLGDPVCTMYAYSTLTTVPATDSTSTCPDGSTGSCDSFAWTNPKVPMDKSPQPASYFTDLNPVCNNPNPNW